MGKTAVEKLISDKIGRLVSEGEFVECPVDFAYCHDGTGVLVIEALKRMGVERIRDPENFSIVFDHSVPPYSDQAATLQSRVRRFAREQGVKKFHDMGEGICHQVVPERGYVAPGMVVFGADSHTCTLGCFGLFATGVGATDLAYILATGKTWMKVPEMLRVECRGLLREMVSSKDLILEITRVIGTDGATYKALEFSGEAVRAMSQSSRMTMSNMAVEMGAKTGFIEADEKTAEFLGRDGKRFRTDQDAKPETVEVDASSLEPCVACPGSVANVKPVREVEGAHIDQAFLGSCTNGRYEDLYEAAKILRGRKVREDTRMIVVPASKAVHMRAQRDGLLDIFLEAGAMVGVTGCGPCLGVHMGVIGENEVAISTSNRNFVGRMGARSSSVYLASPQTVAASAVEGKITDPRRFLR
ncbi:MAG: 3-isopropylmalate dehydratase large subunit [Candidatus Verstraetearchaeota archaeon]|nr:3-isopropylmalate dehydratase large subunit [Candidatus Verstraetearchaeota archaeon]